MLISRNLFAVSLHRGGADKPLQLKLLLHPGKAMSSAAPVHPSVSHDPLPLTVEHAQRLEYPLRRRGDSAFERVSWAPAIAEIERARAFKPPLTEEFPLLLAAGLRTHWKANAIHLDLAWRKGKDAHCSPQLHPDAAATGEFLMQGVNLNEINDAFDLDPISGCPHHKAVPCRVEAIGHDPLENLRPQAAADPG